MSTGATCAPLSLWAGLHGKRGMEGKVRTRCIRQDWVSSPARTAVDLLRWRVPGGVRILGSRGLGKPGRLNDADWQRALARRWRCAYRCTAVGLPIRLTHVWRCGGTGRRRRTDTAACTHKHTRAQDVGRATIIIASSRVRDDGRSIKSRSKASLLAGRIDCRQIAGRTTHTEPRRRAVTEAEGGGGVETETQ